MSDPVGPRAEYKGRGRRQATAVHRLAGMYGTLGWPARAAAPCPCGAMQPHRSGAYAAASSWDVQCGQRRAAIGIVVAQNGHAFSVGDAGATCSSRRSRLMPRTRMKTAADTTRKLMTLFRNTP